jgi:hypothetical protein
MKSDCGSSCKVKNAFVIKIKSCLINCIYSDLALLGFLKAGHTKSITTSWYVLFCFNVIASFSAKKKKKPQGSISILQVYTFHNMKKEDLHLSFL